VGQFCRPTEKLWRQAGIPDCPLEEENILAYQEWLARYKEEKTNATWNG